MTSYAYDIRYKDVKEVTIKVKPTLKVEVVAPFDTSLQYIEQLLNKRKLWIDKHLALFKSAQPLPRSYVSGESFDYLGRSYRLKVITSEHNHVVLKSGILYLYCQDSDDQALKAALIDQFYHTKAQYHFEVILAKYRYLYGDDVVIRIRKMKTRWGSCNPVKRYINLNQALIKKPKRAIEYVVLHEIAHLTYADHSQQFYAYLTSLMPDWKKVKHQLDGLT